MLVLTSVDASVLAFSLLSVTPFVCFVTAAYELSMLWLGTCLHNCVAYFGVQLTTSRFCDFLYCDITAGGPAEVRVPDQRDKIREQHLELHGHKLEVHKIGSRPQFPVHNHCIPHVLLQVRDDGFRLALCTSRQRSEIPRYRVQNGTLFAPAAGSCT